MGQAGAGFAQGFTSTLAQGMQLIEQTRAREEELDLRKKLVGAQLDEHQAKTALATRALAAGTSLQKLLTGVEDTGDMEQGMATGQPPTRPRSISRRDLAAVIAGVDPVHAATLAASPEPTTPEQLQALLTTITKGGGTVPPEPSAPAMPGAETPTTPAGVPGPTTSFVPSISINKDGSLSVTLQGQRTNFQVNTVTLADPKTGKSLMFERVFDPISGAVVAMRPLGETPAPEALQRFAQAATALGFTPGTPGHSFAVGRLALISGLPAELQGEAMTQFETWAQQASGVPAPAATAAPTLARAREAVTREEIAKEQRAVGRKIEEERREPAGTTARKEAEKRVALEPAFSTLDALEKLVPDLGLPKTARGRVTASGRLQLGHTTQDNKALVLFQSLKDGLLGVFARLADVGTLSNQDIERARGLMPTVLPGVLPPTLPDREEIALGKLRQLRELLNEVAKRPPPAVTPLLPTTPAPGPPAARPAPSVTIPRGFRRAEP